MKLFSKPVFGFILLLLSGAILGCSQQTPPSVGNPSVIPTDPAELPTATPQILPTITPYPSLPPAEIPTSPANSAAYPLVDAQPPIAEAYPGPETGNVPIYTYEVVNTYPHDPDAFTQGLVWFENTFYEGTGLYGASSLRQVDPESGQPQQSVPLKDEFFGEGIVVWEDQIIQLTWRQNTAFVYDRDTFTITHELSLPTEGWGITHDGRQLIVSDGSNTLYFREPDTFAESGRVLVYDEAGPVNQLNELEYIDGEVWANVWMTDLIARIDPESGQVVGWIDLSGLRPESTLEDGGAVLNGIAYDATAGRLFVTGKRWPSLFEIEILPIGRG